MGLGWTGELRLPHFNQLQLTVAIGTLLSGLPGHWCFKRSGKTEVLLAIVHFLNCGNWFLIPFKLQLKTRTCTYGKRIREAEDWGVRHGRCKTQPRACWRGPGASEKCLKMVPQSLSVFDGQQGR